MTILIMQILIGFFGMAACVLIVIAGLSFIKTDKALFNEWCRLEQKINNSWGKNGK